MKAMKCGTYSWETKRKKATINGILVIEGLARLESKKGSNRGIYVHNDIYKVLEVEQGKAKEKRQCIWQYGTIPDSDEEKAWERMLK